MAKRPQTDKRIALAAAALIAAPVLGMNSTVEALAEVPDAEMQAAVADPKSRLRTYQIPIFQDQHTKVLLIECSRQIGKSHTLGEWAAARLLLKLEQDGVNEWLIVLISNSKANGVELGQKVAAALRRACEASAELKAASIAGETPTALDTVRDPELGSVSGVPDLELSDFAQRIEVRIGNKRGRVLVLAASPRTARGFSADLGLDEFAFHENAVAIWDAAEPMLDSNPQFVARICSTHNGVGSLFNTWIKGRIYPVYSIRRSDAYYMGLGDKAAMERFYATWAAMGARNAKQAAAWYAEHGLKAQPWDRLIIQSKRRTDAEGNPLQITPEEALAEAPNRASYLQNYENEPAEEGGAFLAWDTITRAEDDGLRAMPVDKDEWSAATLQRLWRLKATAGTFYVGQDFARTTDLSVVTVLHEVQGVARQVARLEMQGRTVPQQLTTMQSLLRITGERTGRVAMDATGNGLGLAEMLADEFGSLILLVNFAETVPMDELLAADGRRQATMGISERMAVDMQRSMDDGALRIMPDEAQRQDLRQPCRIVRGNRVSLAAARKAGDHADRFWALALAEHGRRDGNMSGGWTVEDLRAASVPGVPHLSLPGYVPPSLSAFLAMTAVFFACFVSGVSAAITPRGGYVDPTASPYPLKSSLLALKNGHVGTEVTPLHFTAGQNGRILP